MQAGRTGARGRRGVREVARRNHVARIEIDLAQEGSRGHGPSGRRGPRAALDRCGVRNRQLQRCDRFPSMAKSGTRLAEWGSMHSVARFSALLCLLGLSVGAGTGCSGDPAGDAAATGETEEAILASPGAGKLTWVFCDIKRPLAGLTPEVVTDANYKDILTGFKALGCNGVRVYIDFDKKLSEYPAIYRPFLAEARIRGFRIYANPIGTGDHNHPTAADDGSYAKVVSDYANELRPHFLGPFNETGGMGTDRLAHITKLVRQGAQYQPIMVGPDDQHVATTLRQIQQSPTLLKELDIVGAHNAEDDAKATRSAWNALHAASRGRHTWATENPRDWSEKSNGAEVGVKAVVDSEAQGLVLYLAYPKSVYASGALTTKGQAIAVGLHKK